MSRKTTSNDGQIDTGAGYPFVWAFAGSAGGLILGSVAGWLIDLVGLSAEGKASCIVFGGLSGLFGGPLLLGLVFGIMQSRAHSRWLATAGEAEDAKHADRCEESSEHIREA